MSKLANTFIRLCSEYPIRLTASEVTTEGGIEMRLLLLLLLLLKVTV